MFFKTLGCMFGGSVLIVVATIVPGDAIGLPFLGASGVLTWFGGIAGGTLGGVLGTAGGAMLDEHERSRAYELDQLSADLRLERISEAGAMCIVRILVAAAICDGPMNTLERTAIRDLTFAALQLLLLEEKRVALESLLSSQVSSADAVNDYHLLAPFGKDVQRFTLQLVNAVLFADAEAVGDPYLSPEERAFRTYWADLTADTARNSTVGEQRRLL